MGTRSVAERERLGILLVLLSAVGFGTLGIFGVYAQRAGLSIPTVLVYRFLIAAALVWALLLVTGRAKLLRGRPLLIALALGGLGYATQSGLYFLGLEFMTAGLVAVVLYTYPAFVVLIAVTAIGERVTREMVLALALSLSGIALVSGATPAGASIVGVVVVLGAALAYSFYITVSRAVLRTVDPLVLSAHVLPAAGGTFLVVGSATGDLAVPTAPTPLLILLSIAVLATAVPVVTFFAGLELVGASRAGIVSTAEPPVTVALGALLFAEPVGVATVLGGLSILTGVVLLERR